MCLVSEKSGVMRLWWDSWHSSVYPNRITRRQAGTTPQACANGSLIVRKERSMAVKDIAVVKDGAVYVLKAGTPVYVQTADVCSWTGKTKQWIGQLANNGIINRVQTDYGQFFRTDETVKSYLAMLDEREDKSPEIEKAEAERMQAESSLKKSKATIAALQALEMTGKMHRAEDVSAMTEDLVYTIRSSLLALPGRLAVELAGISDAAEISECIRSEIYKVMAELSRYSYDPAKYEERVRERLKFEHKNTAEDDDDE